MADVTQDSASSTVMVDAITDEVIRREFSQHASRTMRDYAQAALTPGYDAASRRAQHAARRRCAEILRARGKRS